MKPTFQVVNSIGNVITLNNDIQVISSTFLKRDETFGTTTLNVENTTDFDASGILLVSVRDSENAEFIEYSAVPSTTQITITASRLNHSRGESVSSVLWDQFVIESSPDSITWSVASTINIDPTSTFTNYVDNDVAGTYYRVAFKNSVTLLTSGYSEVIQAVAPAFNSAQALINQIISEVGVNPSDTIITQQFLLTTLREARRLFDDLTYGFHWDWREKFNQPYKVLAGTNYIDLPEDIDFDETNRTILNIRLNSYNQGPSYYMNYVDKKRWNDLTLILQGSTVKQDITTGDTSIVLENTGDFPDSGNIYIATTDYDQQILNVQYTANDRVTNTLSGISALSITRDVPVGTQVWARTIGTIIPMNYTVFNKRIYFDNIMPNMMNGRNIYIDYYSRLPDISNPYDILPEHHAHIYKAYVKYAIEKRKDPSTPETHPDYVSFKNQAASVTANMYSGQTLRIITS